MTQPVQPQIRRGFVLLVVVQLLGASLSMAQPAAYDALMQDVLIEADIWDAEPKILVANYGFEGIIGVRLPFNEQTVRAAGGTWMDLPADIAAGAAIPTITSAVQAIGVPPVWGVQANTADAMPVVFSWPLLPETVQPSDFEIHLNDGSVVTPVGVSIRPCHEFNERNVAVVIGEFGNRLPPGTPGALFIERTVIVNDGSPLTLVGPGGVLRSAVGFSLESGNPYRAGDGPRLVGAKLTRMTTAGEDAPNGPGPAFLPNDGVALYGANAEYRLRMLTSAGLSPNGVSGVRPDEFSRYFRLHAEDNGSTVVLTEANLDYTLAGGQIRILGLADLGQPGQDLNAAYVEDWDNAIDIVLSGDEAAMRQITAVEIPAVDGYSPFFNPGGPGNDPTPGVAYTVPGPPDLEPVSIEIDDPQTVSLDRTNRCGPADVSAPFGSYDESDITAVIEWIEIGDPLGDFDSNGKLDFFDMLEYLRVLDDASGCP